MYVCDQTATPIKGVHLPDCLRTTKATALVVAVSTFSGTQKMHISELPRPSPERLLKRVQAEKSKQRGAKLKIFLGYAPGVGKSYRMLR